MRKMLVALNFNLSTEAVKLHTVVRSLPSAWVHHFNLNLPCHCLCELVFIFYQHNFCFRKLPGFSTQSIKITTRYITYAVSKSVLFCLLPQLYMGFMCLNLKGPHSVALLSHVRPFFTSDQNVIFQNKLKTYGTVQFSFNIPMRKFIRLQ